MSVAGTILTLTPNPSLDLLFEAEQLVRDDANRVAAPRRRAGGQGVNLTRAPLACSAATASRSRCWVVRPALNSPPCSRRKAHPCTLRAGARLASALLALDRGDSLDAALCEGVAAGTAVLLSDGSAILEARVQQQLRVDTRAFR